MGNDRGIILNVFLLLHLISIEGLRQDKLKLSCYSCKQSNKSARSAMMVCSEVNGSVPQWMRNNMAYLNKSCSTTITFILQVHDW